MLRKLAKQLLGQRVLIVVVMLLLFIYPAMSEGTDLSSLSDDELISLIHSAQTELDNRKKTDDFVLYDSEICKIKLKNSFTYIDDPDSFYFRKTQIEFEIMNDYDFPLWVECNTLVINGYQVYWGFNAHDIQPGVIYMTDAAYLPTENIDSVTNIIVYTETIARAIIIDD